MREIDRKREEMEEQAMERFRKGRTAGRRWIAAAGMMLFVVASACSKPSPPETPRIETTKAFDALFGEVPALPVPGTAHGTVAYFPSSLEPGKFRPVPIFSVAQGKEESLVVRTVIRGIGTWEGPADALLREIVDPFPPGSELTSLSREGGLARVTVGGSFRADSLTEAQKEKAAKALALTVSQFGKADRAEVIDESGARFGADAAGAEVVDIGPPEILGILAIREGGGQPPGVLSVLFDRPVFVEDAAFYPPGGTAPFAGKIYSAGFGMTLELHPDPAVFFDPTKEYRVRLSVRDGKGRRTSEDRSWRPTAVARH